jgi:hypothetical protein
MHSFVIAVVFMAMVMAPCFLAMGTDLDGPDRR